MCIIKKIIEFDIEFDYIKNSSNFQNENLQHRYEISIFILIAEVENSQSQSFSLNNIHEKFL